MRCGTPGTSGHVTMKSSIYDRGVLYKSGVYARQSSVSYPGRSPMLPWSVACEANWLGKEQSIPTAWGEVSRGHSSRETHLERSCGIIADRDKVKARTV